MAGETLRVHEGLAALLEAAALHRLGQVRLEVRHRPRLHEAARLRLGEVAHAAFATRRAGREARDQRPELGFLGVGQVGPGFFGEVLVEIVVARAVAVGPAGFLKPLQQVALMRGGGAVLGPVTEILAALLGGPVLRGAEVEEVVNHVFLRQRAGHERECLVHRAGRGEDDEHLG